MQYETEAELDAAALSLQIEGHNYTHIAKTLLYSTANEAARAVERAMKRREKQDRAHLREVEAERLNELWLDANNRRRLAEDASPWEQAATLCLKVIDKRIKLLGLAMPTQVEIMASGVPDSDSAATVQALLESRCAR